MARFIPWLVIAGCASASAGPQEAAEDRTAEERTSTSSQEAAEERTAPSAEAMRVEVARIATSEAALELSLPGEIEGARDAQLASSQGGHVEAVLVREGQRVRKGQPLLHIDRSIYRVHLTRAEVDLNQARQDAQRMDRLGDAVTQVERENTQTRLMSAEAAYKLAKLQLERATIRAPFAGTVASRGIEVGEVSSPGAPILRLIQLDPVLVSLSVPDRDVVALAPGDQVQVRTQARPGTRQGVVSRISPAADLKTRTFTVEVEVANPDRDLMPGMIAKVTISKQLADGALVIPQSWLVTTRNETGVFLVEQDREQAPTARWRVVEPSQVVRDQIIIGHGLEPDDRVVITGHRDLAEGDPLIIAREGRCCAHGRAIF